MRWRLALASGIALVLATGLVAAAQVEAVAEIEIIDLDIGRYPQVQMVVDFRNVADLDLGAIVITEDETPIQDFEVESIEASTIPVGVVLVIDVSGSMLGEPLSAAKAAAQSFISQKRSQDFIAIVTFGDVVTVVSAFSSSQPWLASRIDALVARGETALYDGVVEAASLFGGDAARLQRNMIILTDGADTVSEAALGDAVAAVDAQGVRAFGVALESAEFNAEPLQAIVGAADYRAATDLAALESLYGDIKREINNKAVVRFRATQDLNTQVEFGVSFAGTSTKRSLEVPGFVKAAEAVPTTVVTFPQPATYVAESDLPASPETVRLVAAGAVGLVALAFLWILFGPKGDDQDSSLKGRLQAIAGPRGQEGERSSLLSRIPLLRNISARAKAEAQRRGLTGMINSALEQANISLKPGEAVAAAVGVAALIGALVGLFYSSPVVGAVAFGVVVLLAVGAIRYAGRRERNRFENQLPDTLTLISTSLRAGYSLLQAIEAVASEAPNPTAREFGRAMAETRLGRHEVGALGGIANRMESEDFSWAVMAIEIQREVGGNLAEVLQTVANTMLERNRLRRDVRALTAEGRISAIVLVLVPVFLFLYLLTTNPDYMQPLFERIEGIVALGAGVVLTVLGALWLRKIVDIEI